MSVVAIHQPNFFPWLGYFDKVARCDSFVILDDAQIQKTGGSWSNRVAMLIEGKRAWVSAPILRGSGVQTVADTRFDETKGWRERVERTIVHSYRNSPWLEEVLPLLRECLAFADDRVGAFNENAFRLCAATVGIDTKHCVRASTLDVTSTGTERLVRLVQRMGGKTYLCGGGSTDYLDEAAFAKAGLELRFQKFSCVPYAQAGVATFEPGLSVLDALLQLGVAETRALVAGARPSLATVSSLGTHEVLS